MITFNNFSILDKHLSFLQERIQGQNAIFLVGGCIRDLLLDIERQPTDIDLTMAGKPETIYKNIDKKGLSHFITEKYGTITLIRKTKTTRNGDIKYELTPLRTESTYDDNRHPEKIERSNNIVLDAQRRDFTSNCIYYTTQKLSGIKFPTANSKHLDIGEILDKHGIAIIPNENLLIIQHHEYISKLYKNGIFDEKYFAYLRNILTPQMVCIGTKKTKGKAGLLRIIIDPFLGIQDILHKKIKAVGDPDKRFNEDALRIIRAIRIANVLNQKLKECPKETKNKKDKSLHLFDFDKETRSSLRKNHDLIKNIAKERIKDETTKAFTHGNPFGFIALLDEAKLLPIIFPALSETKNREQPIRYHPFDIYTHTLLSVYELQKINTDPLVRFAMLYHDVGKVEQFEAYKDGLSKEEIRAIIAGPLNHRKSSPELAKKDFKMLGFSSKDIETIARYIAHHHSPEEMIYAKKENTEKKVRKFLSESGYERACNIMDICIADRLGQYNPLQNGSDISDVYEIKKILTKLHKKEGQFTMKQLAIDGNDIMKHFKIPASPLIGKLLEKAMQRILDERGANDKTAIFTYLKPMIKNMK